MTFKEAVEKAKPPVNTAYKRQKDALKRDHARKISVKEGSISGSIDIDSALATIKAARQPHRWDYGLGYRAKSGAEYAVWVEVHSAETSEVTEVEKKLARLKEYLISSAPELYDLTTKRGNPIRFVWLASKGINIPKHTQEARRLRQHPELDMPRKRLELP
ncbi:hypothetical protein [Leptonema illini]|jgi:hypothetical protein|uniref:Uncharacterized protein n=1 Tax=Leptonema illini DSM 21528 TaxID=929563 RepID=H2CDC8_9LEPT|nr:hypothetical protein [Leptonema illini]EHQ05432.1 hypothetical protein Lepil_0731 [Leptonema illini DSM 21528]